MHVVMLHFLKLISPGTLAEQLLFPFVAAFDLLVGRFCGGARGLDGANDGSDSYEMT